MYLKFPKKRKGAGNKIFEKIKNIWKKFFNDEEYKPNNFSKSQRKKVGNNQSKEYHNYDKQKF